MNSTDGNHGKQGKGKRELYGQVV